MMKNLFLLFSFLGSLFVSAQIFQEDFDGNGPGIDAWTTLDLDGLTPHANVSFITNGWNRIDRFGTNGNYGGPPGNYAAMSTSWYAPPGTSNDWLISPEIDLSDAVHPILTFDIKAQDPLYPDGYVLRLSPTGSTNPDDFTVILDQSTAAPSQWTKLSFDLVNYISQTIRFALINNTTDKFMLLADNFLVAENNENDGDNPDYCGPLEFTSSVEVMTQVNFSDLSQSTPVTNTESHIMYLDKIANVSPGESYDIVLKGNTRGNFTNRFAVFIDWNQDGIFSGDDEIIEITEVIYGSTGEDDIQATHTILVPENAKPGSTRMRIKKIFGVSNYLDPCLGTLFGQAHDYTVIVDTNIEPGDSICEQSIESNEMENGSLFGGSLQQRLAVDILVQKPEGLRIDKIDFNQVGEATRYKLHFYTSGSDGLPADLIQTVETTFIEKTLIGNNFGYPFYVTSLELNTPIHLPSVGDEVYYWMEIETDAFAWETTTTSKLGKFIAFNNSNTSGAWFESTTEGVYAIYGECENLSIREVIKADALVYPNPIRDKLTVEATKSIRQVELYNLAGQQVLNSRVKMEDNKTKAVVHLAHLPAGVYILKAEIDGEVKTFKIIKK